MAIFSLVFVFTFEEWHSIQVWFLVTNPDKKRTTLLKLPLAQKVEHYLLGEAHLAGPPLFTLSCLFQVALHLSKYASHKLWCIHGFVVESPLAYKSLLSIAPAPYYTHNILLIITLPGRKSVTLPSTCQCGISACRPAWWLNRAVELNSRAGRSKFQLSYSYNAGEPGKNMFQFHLSFSWKVPTIDLKVRFPLRLKGIISKWMCATLHLRLVEKNNKQHKSLQTSRNLRDATIHPN